MLKSLTLTVCGLALVGGLAAGVNAATTSITGDQAGQTTQVAQATVPAPQPPAPPTGPEGGPMPGPRGHGGDFPPPPPPPPSPAAHFLLQHGPTRIDIKCADSDSSQTCAAVAEKLIEKMASIPLPQPPVAMQPATTPKQ